MCTGSGGARERARREQQRLDREARQKQERLDQIAAERTALAEQQAAESASLQQKMANQQAGQKTQVAELEAEQADRVAGIAAAGDAAASALRVLAMDQPVAPTAAMSAGRQRSYGARTSRASLRIGQTGTGRGSGSNLSI